MGNFRNFNGICWTFQDSGKIFGLLLCSNFSFSFRMLAGIMSSLISVVVLMSGPGPELLLCQGRSCFDV